MVFPRKSLNRIRAVGAFSDRIPDQRTPQLVSEGLDPDGSHQVVAVGLGDPAVVPGLGLVAAAVHVEPLDDLGVVLLGRYTI